jgi:hypothetical protein
VRLVNDMRTFYSAYKTLTLVITESESELKVGGLVLLIILVVVEEIGYDMVLGLDFFFGQIEAVIDIYAHAVNLFRAL